MSAIHKDRINKLRAAMRRAGIDYYMIPTADFHNSEYTAEYFHAREFFSGFTGSAGTLVVSADEACLWTDGRYFIQAAAELEGSGAVLMRMSEPGVPTVREYLRQNMKEGGVLGFDGRCVPCREGRALEKMARNAGGSLRTDLDLSDVVWTDRPALPCHPVRILSAEYTGEDTGSKLRRLREKMEDCGARTYIDSKLDCIMWLLNIRGQDVAYNPVALCHILVDERDAYLFIQSGAVTDELKTLCALNRISILPYDDFEEFLRVYDHKGDLMCDPGFISYGVYLSAKRGIASALKRRLSPDAAEDESETVFGLREEESPLEQFKCVKNAVEMANIRDCYRRDSAALCSFIKWVTDQVADPSAETITEDSAAQYLGQLRSRLPGFMGLSFSTISAYGANAAMMHYTAVPGISDAVLKPEGMLLVDSGGQYLTGTTDVTRTFALGPVTDEMKKHYTLTAVSNLQLMGAVFLYGCTGVNLDILAREPMWKEGLDYKCGTGHGIGYFLNVHESPPSIRWRVFPGRQDKPFEPGMIVSDEPGVYLEGKYGIRIETILEVAEHGTNEWGRFLAFEPLTWVPLDLKLIDVRYLTEQTRDLLNDYHMRVREKILPLLDGDDADWLIAQTQPI